MRALFKLTCAGFERGSYVPTFSTKLLSRAERASVTVIPPEELAAIASWCDATGAQFISDEVYHGLVYRRGPTDQLRLADVS